MGKSYRVGKSPHGIYLEDLYVRPEARGQGVGAALLSALAQVCRNRGYGRLQWWVLTWNPAREFYHRLGAVPMNDWVTYRLTGDALHLAADRPSPDTPFRP